MTTLDEEYNIKGIWWLPESPAIEVAGELLYSPRNGVILNLQGDLHAPHDGHFHPPISQDEVVIIGITVKGEPVSLLNCKVVNGRVSIGEYIGIPEASYRISYAFIGVHFLCEEDIKFKKLAVRFSHLDNWINENSFDLEYPVVKDGQGNFDQATLRYKKPLAQCVSANEHLCFYQDYF
jgi:hypothetical protein